MKLMLLILFLILAPYLLGKGSLIIYEVLTRNLKPSSVPASYVCGSVLLLVLCGISHLVTIFLGKSLQFAIYFYGFLLIFFLTIAYVSIVIRKLQQTLRQIKDTASEEALHKEFSFQQLIPSTKEGVLLMLAIFLIALLQLILVAKGDSISLSRDQMAETVSSFLAENAIYQVNPLTGLTYSAGLPMRIKILCLPTFYAFFCKLFDVNVRFFLWNIMPTYWLLISYCAFAAMGKALFPECRDKQYVFFLLTILLLFCSGSVLGQIGFGVFHAGYRATTLRLTILMPFTFTAMIERKRLLLLLPILAESMITWTGYGVGLCFLAVVLYLLIEAIISRKLPGDRKEGRT